jgi:ketosteroid isomerase-like protein
MADRLEIRHLVDAYAECADRGDAAGQIALFTEDADFVVYAEPGNPMPTQRLRGRAALTVIAEQLATYQATMHINGQSTLQITGGCASGVTPCQVHCLKTDRTSRIVTITAVHYLDSYVEQGRGWLIRRRLVVVDWTESRTLTTN